MLRLLAQRLQFDGAGGLDRADTFAGDLADDVAGVEFGFDDDLFWFHRMLL